MIMTASDRTAPALALRPTSAPPPEPIAPLLEAVGISKSYPGVQALTDMSFDLRSGEVHVLFGENGAGKSTLIGILCGAQSPTAGHVVLDGNRIAFASVQDARAAGIAAVFQEFSLAPDLTVEENLFLGAEISARGFLRKGAMRRAARETMAELGFAIDGRTLVGSLSRAERQMVEIAKAMRTKPRVLILDEPTASLTEAETRTLFSLIARLKAEGVGIVYISHRIGEIQEIGDRVTVLRDGRHIATLDAAAATKTQLVELMTGRTFGDFYPTIRFSPGALVLAIDTIRTADGRVRDASLVVNAGEIVGLAGLVGCGKSEIGRACFGLEPLTAGGVTLLGEPVHRPTPRGLLQRGLAYVPSDRLREGLMLGRPTKENLSLAILEGPELSRAGLLKRGQEVSFARALGERMGVRPLSLERPVAHYSGGNMQKVLLGRLLASGMRVLVLDEPTIGIDVGAKADVYELLAGLVANGVGILLISSDLPEVLSLSNRVYVVRDGRIADELVGERRTEEAALANFFGKG
jgi:ribose transport system ATP-binding protein